MTEYRRTHLVTYQTGTVAELRLSTANGNVTVRTHDAGEVRINVVADLWAEAPHDADEDFELVKQGLVGDGNRVTIHAPLLEPRRTGVFFFGRGPRIDYDVRVPRETSINSDGRTGRIDIRGVSGPIEINHHNGAITVEDCARPIEISCHNGKVDVSRAGANVSINGHNGKIEVDRVAGNTTVQTHNGMIEVSDVGGRIDLNTANGMISYSGPIQADVNIEGRNGMIRLRVPRDSRFEIDAESRRGVVTSNLPVSNAPRSDAPRPTVRLRTRQGQIRIDAL